jgi:hypothetical protein
MRPALCPAHLLFFDKSFGDDLIDGGFDKTRGNRFTIAVAFALIGNHQRIIFNVDLKFFNRFLQFKFFYCRSFRI